MNNILKCDCKLNGLEFIDNSNICAKNLFEDGSHLNHDGKVILANNFIYDLNTIDIDNIWDQNRCQFPNRSIFAERLLHPFSTRS